MKIFSPAFESDGKIPITCTADGINDSPPLEWESIPDGTQSLAIICDDPDAPAGTWVHWVIFNIPAQTSVLEKGISPVPVLTDGSRQGINDFGKIGYGGPAPPRGTHRYFFKLYALDIKLDCESGITKRDLLETMEGHILSEARLMGTYSR
jgi:Raf kinase inhibitor-like YbhB/YbcL family protein